ATIMLAAHQQVDVPGRRLDLVVEFINIRFAVSADHHLRLGHLPRPLTGDLQRPDPPSALLLIERSLIAPGRITLRWSRPDLRPSRSQGNVIQAKGLQAMQEQPVAVALAKGPQTRGLEQ